MNEDMGVLAARVGLTLVAVVIALTFATLKVRADRSVAGSLDRVAGSLDRVAGSLDRIATAMEGHR